jgi:hypothetical protein
MRKDAILTPYLHIESSIFSILDLIYVQDDPWNTISNQML